MLQKSHSWVPIQEELIPRSTKDMCEETFFSTHVFLVEGILW